jgi:hypothetical protein
MVLFRERCNDDAEVEYGDDFGAKTSDWCRRNSPRAVGTKMEVGV